MEPSSTTPATQPSADVQKAPPYFFSTHGGQMEPRFLGVDKPQAIARSDVAIDTADMVLRLRTKWPQICFSIFTDPTHPTGFDPRWFWDEVDDYVLGREFLFNVICTIIKENEAELFKYVREWNGANAQSFDDFPYILYQGIDFVFNPQDRDLRGDEFLNRALQIIRQAYERACLDAEAQATSQSISRGLISRASTLDPMLNKRSVTSSPGPSNLSRISTAEDQRTLTIPTSLKRGQRSTSNVGRSISASTPAPHMTPSMRARGPMGTANTGSVPPQYYYQGPNPQFAQDRTWMPSPNMGHVFQGQVPAAPPYGQYPMAGPNQFFPQYHGNPHPPMQPHPSNLARIPTQGLINNIPAYGSGTLPFPDLPILPHPQDLTLPQISLHPSQISATSFPFQNPMASNIPPQMQYDGQPMSIPEGQPWMNEDRHAQRPSDGSDRGRRYSTTRGRGRGNFSARGRRSSSSHGHQVNPVQRNGNSGPQRPLGSTSPPFQLPDPVDTMPKIPSNTIANGNMSKQPRENEKFQKNGATKALGNGAGTHNVNATVLSAAKISQDSRSPEHQRGGRMPLQGVNAGPAPRSKNGNIDNSRIIGPQFIGENVEDLFQLFVGGLVGCTEADTKAIFDSYVAVKDVKLTSAKTNAFVQFHSTADVRRLLQQTNEGRLYVGPIDDSWCLYVETPRSRQHAEVASHQGSRARPHNTFVPQQSPELNKNISATRSNGSLSTQSNIANRDSPTKKGKRKAANTQHKPIYTPQDARSQFPPQAQAQSASKSSNMSFAQEQPPPKPSTWATIASSKQDNSETAMKVDGAEQVEPIKGLADQKQSSSLSEVNILRQVQNQQIQTPDKTIGQPQRPTPAGPQQNQNSSNIEVNNPVPPSETAQLPTLPPNREGQRKTSKPIIPALPLKSPTNSKSISPSDESGLAGPKSMSPVKSTNSENENNSVSAQVVNEDPKPLEEVAKDSPRKEKIHDAVQQPLNFAEMENTPALMQAKTERTGNLQSSGPTTSTGTNGDVDHDQSSHSRQNAKKSKDKKKKKKASNAQINSETGTLAAQADLWNHTNQKMTETAPSRNDTQASRKEALNVQTSLNNNNEEELKISSSQDPSTSNSPGPSTSISQEPLRSIDDPDRSVRTAELDPGWRHQYDEVMQHLTKVQPALQDEITRETLDFRKAIVDVEEKILMGDKETSRTATQKKTWLRKRKRLLDEYKALIEERLPMLAGKVQASAQPKTPSIQTDTTSPSSPALSVQSEAAIIKRAQSTMKGVLGMIPLRDQISTGRGDDGSTWVAVPVNAFENQEGGRDTHLSASPREEDRPGVNDMDRLIKGEQAEQSPLPSISLTMDGGNRPDPAAPDTEAADQITEQIDGLEISGISAPTNVEGDETESITTEATSPDSQPMRATSPQSPRSPETKTQGTLRGGDGWKEPDPLPGQEKPKGPQVVSPSRQPAAMSYASVAKLPKHVGATPLPGFSDPSWNTKAKVIDSDASSIGSSGPTPASGTSTVSRRTSNATKGKDKAGGDDWAVKHGEKVWGDQGFQQS